MKVATNPDTAVPPPRPNICEKTAAHLPKQIASSNRTKLKIPIADIHQYCQTFSIISVCKPITGAKVLNDYE
jgi:hypothetical protein